MRVNPWSNCKVSQRGSIRVFTVLYSICFADFKISIFRANNDAKPDNQSDSEGETEEGDYTVYECPGLAPVRY